MSAQWYSAPAPDGGNVFCFGSFILERHRLFRLDSSGTAVPVALGTRAFDLLRLLVERQGEVVTRDEIAAAVWHGLTVVSNNLSVQIAALRRVVDSDRAAGSCIATVPGRGYRFALPSRRLAPPGEVGSLARSPHADPTRPFAAPPHAAAASG